ncbi:MAG TPA: glycosyltransferase family 4 protein [Candidatus Acidoferrales bacterium]|nr:glycosyltransferase family 4 protein [Candidatus Acidoferrales bacterium]
MIVGLFSGISSVGGVQTAGRQTAAALTNIANDLGWPCFFMSLNDSSEEHEACAAGTHFRFRGFARRKSAFTLEALNLARGKPKLIFAAHPNLSPIASAMKVVAGNARIIAGTHGIEVWQPLSAMRRRALRQADLIVAPSSDTMRRLAQIQGVPEGKIRKLPWPLDPEFLALASFPVNLPPPEGFPHGQVVLSVGRWSSAERYKGADILIHSVAKLSADFPDVHLVLVGPGDDIPRLKQEAEDCGAPQRIHFFTELSRNELGACYFNAHVFALPSTGEGFGLVFLEAMAFAKPVLGANAGGIPDVVEHDREGLLVSPETEAVSSALAQLLSNPVLRAELGKRGKQRVIREFSFECFQQRLLNTVKELIEAAPAEVDLAKP